MYFALKDGKGDFGGDGKGPCRAPGIRKRTWPPSWAMCRDNLLMGYGDASASAR